jgi:truncated hemoglobin YjbI
METVDLPKFPTRHGHMTEAIQRAYVTAAIPKGLLPKDAHRMPEIVSLTAPSDPSKPIQFWQLYSVLGQDPIVGIVQRFYERVFADEPWFTSVFEMVGGIGHHINTQASMWIDVMGGGPYYHGAEFRLSFHHTHNAMALMNDRGAERWSNLMLNTLDSSSDLMTDDPRIRASINTFLAHFMSKYADEFAFENRSPFGETNAPITRKINFMKMSSEAIEALSKEELSDALAERGVDVSRYPSMEAMVSKALMI